MATNVNRRALLASLAAATTAAAGGASASVSISENPTLLALGDKLAAAIAEYWEAVEARDWIIAEWRHRWPLAPDQITMTGKWPTSSEEKDMAGRPIIRPGEERPRRVFTLQELNQWVGFVKHRIARTKSDRLRTKGVADLAKCRKDLEKGEAYWGEIDRLREVSGLNSAKQRIETARELIEKIAAEVMAEEARTMEGVVIHAQAVEAWAVAWGFITLPDDNPLKFGARLASTIMRLAREG